MCFCDCDGPEFYNADSRKARKTHRCSDCRRDIEPGETYTVVSGSWDGDFSTFKICGHCEASSRIFTGLHDSYTQERNRNPWCGCVSLGGLWSQVGDEIAEGNCGPNWARLKVSASHKWRYRRGPRKGELMPVPAFPEGVRASDSGWFGPQARETRYVPVEF